MEVRIKRIYEPAVASDGCRILVDRLWPRGVSKEKASLDLWLKEIAPSTELRKWFQHDAAKWEAFKEKYRKELTENNEAVAVLKQKISRGRVTLLYAAKDEQHNEARVLQEVLGEL